MLVTIDTAYADTTAADLSLAVDGPERPALHELRLALPDGVSVRLRLLGASHQVLLVGPGTTRTETVACLPGQPPELPAEARRDDGRYRFASRVDRLPRQDLAARMAELRGTLADDPYALVGIFPGDEDAVTALRVRHDEATGRVSWQTWHAYPQTGELVETTTEVDLP